MYNKYLRKKLGLLNLFGKITGRFLFLILTSILAYKLSVKDFASFAIFWTAYKMFTFLCSNNLYIVYFNKARKKLVTDKKWCVRISSNVIFTALIFSIVSSGISFFIFQNFIISIVFIPIIILSVVIRCVSEFSKSNDSVSLSIFIEDIMFYFLLFGFSIVGLFVFKNFLGIVFAILLATFFTALIGVFLFKRKFKIRINSYIIKWRFLSLQDFKLGFTYTILRSGEFLSSFGVRYFGQLYFGDVFVAYTHVMYQFYNLFSLISISVISGLQSKITAKQSHNFNRIFIRNTYHKIIKTTTPIILATIFFISIFSSKILEIFFPKYSSYSLLLVKVALTSLLFLFFQPLIYIFIYNNRVKDIKTLNIFQYTSIIIIFILPQFIDNLSQEIWLLLIMTSFIIIQGVFSLINLKKTQ